MKKLSTTRYTVTVWITLPIYEEDDVEENLTPAAQRALERTILRALAKVDPNCDCECLEAETIHADGPEGNDDY